MTPPNFASKRYKMKIRLIKRKKEVDLKKLANTKAIIRIITSQVGIKSTSLNIWLSVIFIFYCIRYYAGKYEFEVLK